MSGARQRVKREDQLGGVLGGLSEESLVCRDLCHAWRSLRTLYERRTATYERVLLCTRCGTERSQTLDRYGLVVSSSYRYPKHYRIVGLGRMSMEDRGVLRLAALHQGDAIITEIGEEQVG